MVYLSASCVRPVSGSHYAAFYVVQDQVLIQYTSYLTMLWHMIASDNKHRTEGWYESRQTTTLLVMVRKQSQKVLISAILPMIRDKRYDEDEMSIRYIGS